VAGELTTLAGICQMQGWLALRKHRSSFQYQDDDWDWGIMEEEDRKDFREALWDMKCNCNDETKHYRIIKLTHNETGEVHKVLLITLKTDKIFYFECRRFAGDADVDTFMNTWSPCEK